MSLLSLPGLLAILAAGALVWLWGRDHRKSADGRAELFADCGDLFSAFRVTREGPGYPSLTGTYRGLPIRLEAVVDQVAWRKLPSLWLKATVLAPNPWPAALDILMRAQGVEFYSPSDSLAHTLRLPAPWTAEATAYTDDPDGLPPLERLEPHAAIFADPHMKELVATPRGVRLVRQAWQAERGPYLVLRQAVFTEKRLDPTIVAAMLNHAIAISRDLCAAQPEHEAA